MENQQSSIYFAPLPGQELAPRAEGLLACTNPKQECIRHAVLAASRLPPACTSHSAREKQVLAAATAFKERWVASASAAAAARGVPTCRLLPAVTMLNEFGAEKLVCTTLRPSSLPYVELYDLEGIAQASCGWERLCLAGVGIVPDAGQRGMQAGRCQEHVCLHCAGQDWLHNDSISSPCPTSPPHLQFVAEFFTYEPLEDLCQPPAHLVSPWSLLEWQVCVG